MKSLFTLVVTLGLSGAFTANAAVNPQTKPAQQNFLASSRTPKSMSNLFAVTLSEAPLPTPGNPNCPLEAPLPTPGDPNCPL
jgi:hypothetical protein